METINSVLNLYYQTVIWQKIDIMDAYYSITILSEKKSFVNSLVCPMDYVLVLENLLNYSYSH